MKVLCKFPTVNISKRIFVLVICIAKNFIWSTLKVFFFAPSDSRLSNSCISGKCINLNFEKYTLMTGFVVQGHI